MRCCERKGPTHSKLDGEVVNLTCSLFEFGATPATSAQVFLYCFGRTLGVEAYSASILSFHATIRSKGKTAMDLNMQELEVFYRHLLTEDTASRSAL